MEYNESEYRNKISYIAFILSIMVINIHVYNVDMYSSLKSDSIIVWIEDFMQAIYGIADPGFFALSGYLLFCNLGDKNIGRKLRDRVFSLIIPYFIWNFISFLFFQSISLIPIVRNSLNSSIETFSIKSILISTLIGNHNVTWFLRNLIFFTYFFSLINKLLRNKYCFSLMGILVIVLEKELPFSINGWSIYGGAIHFLIGVFAALYLKKIIKRKSCVLERIFALIIIVMFAILQVLFNILSTHIGGYILMLIKIICFWIIFDWFAILQTPKWWMRITFFTYVSHSMVLESLEKLILIICGDNSISAIIDYIFSPLITFGGLVFAAWMLKKYCKTIWNISTGNR